MATYYLINNVRVGSSQLFAGTLLNDLNDNLASIRAVGGVYVPSTHGPVAEAAVRAQELRLRGGRPERMAELMISALAATQDRLPKGPNLTDAAATIHLADGRRRVLPAATLTAGRILTLGVGVAPSGGPAPRAGERIEIQRLDATANTYTIANGGPGAGNLLVMPVSRVSFGVFEFNGVDWELAAGVG